MGKKRVKMTIKVDPDAEEDQQTITADTRTNQVLDNVEDDAMDVDPVSRAEAFSEIIPRLEALSGLKLVKYVISSSKDVCKCLSPPPLLQFSKDVSERISKTCGKHTKSIDKAEKFFGKCFPPGLDTLSCDHDLFKTVLKYGLKSAKNAECGSSIIRILQSVVSVGAYLGKVTSPTLGIQMIVSHSKAADIFLESHKFVKKASAPKFGDSSNYKGSIVKEVEVEEEQYSEIKAELLRLWKNLVIAFTKISKHDGTDNDKKILENSVPYLLQMYTATRSKADLEIFDILQLYTGKKLQISVESMPLFGPKCFETAPPKASNPLFAHSSKANAILGLINERQAFQTGMEYDEEGTGGDDKSKLYDIRFLLPLLCHTIDARNICDSIKVVSNGWIYLIVRGLSLEDAAMRNVAFLAYKLLIQNFQLPKKGYKVQDIKVWLHFLLSVRKGIQSLGTCKLNRLLSTWVVAAWEAIREPAHPLYQRLTTLLFAKPVIDLRILPDFLSFYNAADGNRSTREWILNVLTLGLKTKEDWQVAQRNPTINALCSSFLVESVFVQRNILQILCSGARIPEVAQEMVDKHSLLVWIANVPCHNQFYKRELHDLFRVLEENCPENEFRRSMFQFVSSRHESTWNSITTRNEARRQDAINSA